MDWLNDRLNELVNHIRDVKHSFETVIKASPRGKLAWQKRGSQHQLFHAYYENDHRVRRGINNDIDMQKKLAKKEFAIRAEQILTENLKALESATGRTKPFDPKLIIRSMPTAYKKLPEAFFFDHDRLVSDLHLPEEQKTRILRHRDWGKQDYQASAYKPEHKKHQTSNGLKMRSKSEVLIMEKLYHYGIDARYEQEWVFGNDRIAPDFTFEDEHRQLFHWEHLGMMDDPRYAAHNYDKLMKYFRHGFILGKNLIVSFDLNGTIDMKQIDFIIQNEIIPRL